MTRQAPRREPQQGKVSKTIRAMERELSERCREEGEACRSGAAPPAGSWALFATRADGPVLRISAQALATLAWAARHSASQCCLWGMLELAGTGQLRLAEAILARHQGSAVGCTPDMAWYGDLLAGLHAERLLEPWQLACWIHTHPLGLGAPSVVDRTTFAARFGRERLAVMLIVTPDLKLYGELSVCLAPLPAALPARFSAPLAFIFEEPAARLEEAELKRLEEEYASRAQPLNARRSPPPWPWDAPTELWPEDDPDFHPADEPYLPPAWIKAWRQARLDLPQAELEDYLRGFLGRDAQGRGELAAAAWELDQIALYFDSERMSVWAAAMLRERLRALARRLGWWPPPQETPAPGSPS